GEGVVGVAAGGGVGRLHRDSVAGAVDEGAGAEGERPVGAARAGGAAAACHRDVVGAGGGEVAGGVGAVPAGVRAGVFLDRDFDGRDRGAGVGGGPGEGAVPAGRVVVRRCDRERDGRGRGAVVVDEARGRGRCIR